MTTFPVQVGPALYRRKIDNEWADTAGELT
jgi:hypothetical protein